MKQEVVVIKKVGEEKVKRELVKDGELVVVIKAEEEKEYVVEVEMKAKKDEVKGEMKVVGVVSNGASLKVRGLVGVGKKIKGAEMRLEMRFILLDKKSRVEVEPDLEIATEEVKASHAATVGSIDGEELFYLMSRGLKKEEAEKLWLKGWAEKVVKTIRRGEDRERVVKLLSSFEKNTK